MIRPEDVHTRAELVAALEYLRRSAARGTRRSRVSLDQLARLTDVPRSTIHSYVSGKTLPPSDVLDDLLRALGVEGPALGRWADALERASASDTPAPTASAAPKASTMPRAPRQLWGRDETLDVLTTELTATGPQGPLVLLTGMAGVGKTALALTWGARHRAHFPDGQLYVDLRGYSGVEPVLPAAAITRLLLALGQRPEDLPRTQDALVDHYRATLYARRLLLILDNAADASQVEQLVVSSPGVASLVTSRDALSSIVIQHGAVRVPVPPVDAPSSRRWLESSAPSLDPGSLHALVQGCRGLPLALQLVAERLRIDPTRATAESMALDPLATLSVPGLAIRDTIGWSVDRLSAPDRAAFARLGVVPGGRFCSDMARVVLDDPQADRVLRRLKKVGLLDEDDGWRRHDLVTNLAREHFLRLDSAERDRIVARLRGYIVGLLRAADPHPWQLRDPRLLALPAADLTPEEAGHRVRTNEDVIVGLTVEALTRNELAFATDAVILLTIAAERHSSSLRFAHLLRRVHAAAERSEDEDCYFQLTVRLAAVEHQQGRLPDAVHVLSRAVERVPPQAPDGRWTELTARLFNNYSTLGQVDTARRYLPAILDSAASAPHDVATMAWLYVGVFYATVGEHATADEYFARAAAPDAAGRLSGYGFTALLNLLGTATHEARIADARALLERALTQGHLLSSERLRGQLLLMWGALERVAGNHGESLAILRDASEVAERQGDAYNRVRIRIQLARNHHALQDLDAAEEQYRQALFLARQHTFGYDELCAGIELVGVLLERDRSGTALSLLDQLGPVLHCYGSPQRLGEYESLRERAQRGTRR